MEEAGNILTNADEKSSLEAINASIVSLQQKMEALKCNVKLPWGESPFLLMQMSIVNSHLSQCFLPGFPFATGSTKPLQQRYDAGNSSKFVDALSDVMAAAKRQVSDLLIALPAGHEFFLTNLEWAAVHQGLRMAAKLDAVALNPRIASLTEASRRFLDAAHMMRQIMLRLESATTLELDDMGDRDIMWHFRRWFQVVEQWHSSHLQSSHNRSAATTPMTATATPDTPSATAHDMIDPLLWTVGTPIDGPRPLSNDYLGQSDRAGEGEAAFSILEMMSDDEATGYDSGGYMGPGSYGSAHSHER